MTQEPERSQMPLTLEFTPDWHTEDEIEGEILDGIVLVQPSRGEEGRIFVGVNPFGKRVGCHLLPEEARRVRDHLNVLLLEPDAAVTETHEEATAKIEGGAKPAAGAWTPEQLLAWKQKRDAAVPVRRLRLPRPQFKIEFKWGSFEALIVRLNRRG